MKKPLALILAVLCSTFAAHADEVTVKLADTVDGHPGVTYADLLRQVIPGLSGTDADWTGGLPTGVSHIDGPDAINDVPETLEIDYLSVQHLQSGGHDTIWILFDQTNNPEGGQYALLATFDDSPKPKLIDAVQVDTDRFTSFVGAPVRISPNDEAIVITSSHFNAGESYDQPALMFLKGGKLSEVARLFIYNMSNCTEFERTSYAFSTSPTESGLWTITLEARHGIAKFDSEQEEGCPEPADADFNLKTYGATYVWNAKASAYETTNDTLSGLYPDEGDGEGDEAGEDAGASDAT